MTLTLLRSELVSQGRSYRLIGRELGLSKNTVAEIVKRTRQSPLPDKLFGMGEDT